MDSGGAGGRAGAGSRGVTGPPPGTRPKRRPGFSADGGSDSMGAASGAVFFARDGRGVRGAVTASGAWTDDNSVLRFAGSATDLAAAFLAATFFTAVFLTATFFATAFLATILVAVLAATFLVARLATGASSTLDEEVDAGS